MKHFRIEIPQDMAISRASIVKWPRILSVTLFAAICLATWVPVIGAIKLLGD